MSDVLLIERREAVVTLTLNRPDRKNALSIELRDAISDTLDDLAADESVSCLVITGAGDVFSSGFDLKEFERAATDGAFGAALWASSDRYHHAVYQFPLPTIAMVNGPAVAGGCDLAVMCDLRIGSTTARFSHPEYTFGDVVYGPLHDLVGGAVARELCMTGRVLDAGAALGVHLLNQVAEPGALAATVAEMADRIVRAPRHLLMRTKAKAVRRGAVTAGATLDL